MPEETARFGWLGLNLWDQKPTVCGLIASVPTVLLGQRQHGLRGFVTTN